MRRLRLVCGCLAIAMLPVALPSLVSAQAKKAEPPTGVVTGQVSCADTNAPARFAVVTLERVPDEKERADPKAKSNWLEGEGSMNATATTDLEGRFVIDKVPVGRYFVIGILSGYMGPLSRFDHDDLTKISAETRKEMLRLVPTVNVEAGQAAQVTIRLDHASELSGTVLYDDGSPAIHLQVKLLRKTKTGEIASMDGIVVPGFGAQVETDDRGRYRLIGVPPGEYSVAVTIRLEKVAFAGLLGDGGVSINVWGSRGGEVNIYSGNKFRKKDAKITKVSEGEQLGGLDVTIPLAGLHKVQGTVTAKRDGHPLNKGKVALLYEDDGAEAQYADVDRDGNFELPYVPEDRYLLRVTGGEDTELIQKHEFNSNFTEEKTLKKYGQVDTPLIVQADMTSLELAAPEFTEAKAPKP
jgi:hypothetical protein